MEGSEESPLLSENMDVYLQFQKKHRHFLFTTLNPNSHSSASLHVMTTGMSCKQSWRSQVSEPSRRERLLADSDSFRTVSPIEFYFSCSVCSWRNLETKRFSSKQELFCNCTKQMKQTQRRENQQRQHMVSKAVQQRVAVGRGRKRKVRALARDQPRSKKPLLSHRQCWGSSSLLHEEPATGSSALSFLPFPHPSSHTASTRRKKFKMRLPGKAFPEGR